MNEVTLAQFRKECERLNKRLAWTTKHGHKAGPKFMTWSHRYVATAYDRREIFYTVIEESGKPSESKFALPLSYAEAGHRFFDVAGVPQCHPFEAEAPAPPPEARYHARVVNLPPEVNVVFEFGPETIGYGVYVFTHVASGMCLVGKSVNIRAHMRAFKHEYNQALGSNRRLQELINESPLIKVDFHPTDRAGLVDKYREVYQSISKENLLNTGFGKVGNRTYQVRYQPVIDEVSYLSLSDASEKLILSVGIVRARCLSPKYKNWRLYDSQTKVFLAKEYGRANQGKGKAA